MNMTNRSGRTATKSRMPTKTETDLDAAVEQLFTLIQVGFDRQLVLRLGREANIDMARAETELRLLDLFAVYFAIKATDCAAWRPLGATVFERVCTKVLTWWSTAWDTKDDVVEVLSGRFAAYNRLSEVSGRADLQGMSMLVGLLCAVTIRGDLGVFSNDDAKSAGKAFGNPIVGLLENNDLLHTTAATVFRTRFDAVSEFFQTLSRLKNTRLRNESDLYEVLSSAPSSQQ